ncbi:MAG: hypothetical protein JWM68_3907 [Verrucomicrobiales bacterium]|nr:hypothetical protein [Verrucomicrobiales bacterium]
MYLPLWEETNTFSSIPVGSISKKSASKVCSILNGVSSFYWEAMSLIVIGILALLFYAAVWLGIIPPPHAVVLLKIRKGAVLVTKGNLKGFARSNVAEILLAGGVTRGFIAITPAKRVSFSRQIPSSLHQRLRNVLLNQ